MAYRRLFLFIEGDDDERFFRAVLFPLLDDRYDDIRPVQYSKLKKAKVAAYLRSVQAIPGAEYILVRDLDFLPCVTQAKDKVRRHFPQAEPERIQVVKSEIESWYCAGIPEGDSALGALRISSCLETGEITKEVFREALDREGIPSLPALLALLERFDRDRAARRNASFRYFLRKFAGLPGA